MYWVLLSLVVAGAVANPVDEGKAVATADAEERDEKFLSIFQIVKFNNDACEAVDGTMGTCYTAAEYTSKGGEERGKLCLWIRSLLRRCSGFLQWRQHCTQQFLHCQSGLSQHGQRLFCFKLWDIPPP